MRRARKLESAATGSQGTGLTTDALGQPVDAAMDVLDRQVGQMVRLVDDLLDAGRISRGKMVLRKERVEERSDRPLLVALTGWGQDEDRRRTEEAGFDAHLVKPVDEAALGKMLDDLCASKLAAGSVPPLQHTSG